MHIGEDTEFYLAKGFDVVAIEANSTLVQDARRRFAAELADGRLRILEIAISDQTGTEELAVADDMTIWTSLSPDIIERNRRLSETRYRYVEVASRRFEEVLEEVGIPHYLKVDIEGLDMLCVEALHAFDEQPDFVSIESRVTTNRASPEATFDELAQLWTLGYRRFQYVDQSRQAHRRCPYPPREGAYVDARFSADASGPFGCEAPGDWKPVMRTLSEGYVRCLQHNLNGYGAPWSRNVPAAVYRRLRKRLVGRTASWYDLHAALCLA